MECHDFMTNCCMKWSDHRAKVLSVDAPDLTKNEFKEIEPISIKEDKVSVFTDVELIRRSLSHPSLKLVDDISQAKIVWSQTVGWEDLQKLINEQQLINQFPNDEILAAKDQLFRTVESSWGSPEWFLVTYDLTNQLEEWVGDYLTRKQRQEDNHWIIKPHRMARSMDTTITKSMNEVLRLVETGPKVASKYIEKPCTFGGKKFDLRYVILVHSTVPLRAYVYQMFWTRFSLVDYGLTDLDNYNKHFTVMNYVAGHTMKHVTCEEFIPRFESEYNQTKWSTIQSKIDNMQLVNGV
eukprot:NODE_1905_length_1759_cov_43.822738_g1620_i0.p1 GENE.NODE_1905_length_1759_cov_43.822738_g1620_i0~~NODE_1905_length_1759_cov_43.822738_g1620_i0.p1  ORF type:complete len:295 (-),score=44.16 NODE_1905_length_1759_cov_43.822738_g1620_i0:247-1131(-)